jgi:hypothetical protein
VSIAQAVEVPANVPRALAGPSASQRPDHQATAMAVLPWRILQARHREPATTLIAPKASPLARFGSR